MATAPDPEPRDSEARAAPDPAVQAPEAGAAGPPARPAARTERRADVADKALAFENIRSAAQFFGIDMKETDWRQLGTRARPGRSGASRHAPGNEGTPRRERTPPGG